MWITAVEFDARARGKAHGENQTPQGAGGLVTFGIESEAQIRDGKGEMDFESDYTNRYRITEDTTRIDEHYSSVTLLGHHREAITRALQTGVGFLDLTVASDAPKEA